MLFPPPPLSADIVSVDKLCLYSNGNYIGEFDDMQQIEEYLKERINPYHMNPKGEFNAHRYSVIPSKFLYLD